MTIHTLWQDDAQSTILMKFAPDWSWEDLQTAVSSTDSMIGSVVHRVDLIIDLSEGLKIPGDVREMVGSLLNNGAARPNEGVKIVVGANRLLRMIYGGVRRFYASQLGDRELLFANDLDHAQLLLNEERDQQDA